MLFAPTIDETLRHGDAWSKYSKRSNRAANNVGNEGVDDSIAGNLKLAAQAFCRFPLVTWCIAFGEDMNPDKDNVSDPEILPVNASNVCFSC